MVICLMRGAINDFFHGPTDVTATISSFPSLKSRLVQPIHDNLTQLVMEKRTLKGCLSKLVSFDHTKTKLTNGGFPYGYTPKYYTGSASRIPTADSHFPSLQSSCVLSVPLVE